MRGLNIKQLIPWRQAGLLILGLAATAFLIFHFGVGEIGGMITAVGRSLLIVLLISFLSQILRTFAWKAAFTRKGIPFLRLFRISLGGAALDAWSPFLFVGGDSYRMGRVPKDLELEEASSAIIADQAVRSLPLFLLLKILPIRKKLSPALQGRLEERERHLQPFSSERRSAFCGSLFIYLLVALLAVAEIYVIGSSLLPDFCPGLALLMAAAAPVIRLVFCFIPGAFGALEAAFAFIAGAALGHPAGVVGLAVMLVLRLRTFFWAVIGLALVGNPFGMFFGK